MEIPIIGSPADKSMVATNKATTRAILMDAGIPVPPGQTLVKGQDFKVPTLPCVVKPVDSENSQGVTLVHDLAGLDPALEKAFGFSDEVIIDKFIQGREIRCSVIERTLSNGQVEKKVLIPQEYLLDHSKIRCVNEKLVMDFNGLPLDRAPTTQTKFMSMDQEPDLISKIQKVALDAHNKLQFRDFSIFDMRLDSNGNPWILEANLFCSFGWQSVLVTHASEIGLNDTELFKIMVNNALSRSTKSTGSWSLDSSASELSLSDSSDQSE